MRFYVGRRGLSGVSFSVSERNSGGCFTLILIVIVAASILSPSSPSEEEIKKEASTYNTTAVTSSRIKTEICHEDSTDDSTKLFFNENLGKKWYKAKVIVKSLSSNSLQANDFYTPGLNYAVKMTESKALKVGDIINVKFVPTGYSKYSCELNGSVGKYSR